MHHVIVLNIEDGSTPNVEVEAFNGNSATISIQAANLQEAQELLQRGEDLATQAAKDVKPAPQDPGQDELQKLKSLKKRITEEHKREASEYEATAGGRLFLKAIEASRAFFKDNCKKGLTISQINYLYNKNAGSFAAGSFDIAALYFRMGYNKALKDAKQA